jgi:hypothetical protein
VEILFLGLPPERCQRLRQAEKKIETTARRDPPLRRGARNAQKNKIFCDVYYGINFDIPILCANSKKRTFVLNVYTNENQSTAGRN